MGFIIYKMEDCNYIGSCNNLHSRYLCHISRCHNEKRKRYNLKVYKYIRKKNIQIKLIPIFEYNKNCSDRIKKLVEQFYINKYDSITNGLNIINAFGFDKKKYNKKYCKEWREKNKAMLKQKINCPICNCLIGKNNLKRHQKSKKCLKVKNNLI